MNCVPQRVRLIARTAELNQPQRPRQWFNTSKTIKKEGPEPASFYKEPVILYKKPWWYLLEELNYRVFLGVNFLIFLESHLNAGQIRKAEDEIIQWNLVMRITPAAMNIRA